MTHPRHATARRDVLRGLLGVAGAVALPAGRAQATTCDTAPSHFVRAPEVVCELGAGFADWHDPASWPDGRIPGPGTRVVVDRPMRISRDAAVGGIDITGTGHLLFAPSSSIRLASTRNVVVRGQLTMRPASHAVEHVLVFEGVDEAAFVGGGMEVLESDVGLWVVDTGVLELQGSDRTAWGRSATSLLVGDVDVALESPPAGWQPGDELRIVPTLRPDAPGFVDAYDAVRVTSTDGSRVAVDQPLVHPHPRVADQWGAEVLNLTRNVRIEGTAAGRAHVLLLHVHHRQTLRNVTLRHLGPRQAHDGHSRAVLGRYALHFHHCGDGSRGSLVEDVVVTQAGGHAFVPHLSNGITFRGCISHETYDDAYWWDGPADTRSPTPPSDDIIYDRCVASDVRCDPPFRGYRLCGFNLRDGMGNACVDSVAVGVRGNGQASGFQWPEGSSEPWGFSGNRSHNNAVDGLFVWQNNAKPHVISDTIAFHNGSAGIDQGAYGTAYTYEDVVLWGNFHGVRLHAGSAGAGQVFRRVAIDGAGVGLTAITAARHQFAPGIPTVFEGCRFTGVQVAAAFDYHLGINGASQAESVELRSCSLDVPRGRWFRLHADVHPDSLIVVAGGGGRLEVRPQGAAGDFEPAWNARVRQTL